MGTVAALNCGAGDLKVTFDQNNPIETERAKRMVQDMLRRGYALFVETDTNKFVKVTRFDEKQAIYIVGDGPLYAGDQAEVVDPGAEPEAGGDEAASPSKPRGRPRKNARAFLMANSKAIGVAPTSGG